MAMETRGTGSAKAVQAEGGICGPGAYRVLHLHPIFNDHDIYGDGAPTRIAHAERDVRQPRGSLPVSDSLCPSVYAIPWFKRYRPRQIEEHALAYRKVAEKYEELLENDPGDPPVIGGWRFSAPMPSQVHRLPLPRASARQ